MEESTHVDGDIDGRTRIEASRHHAKIYPSVVANQDVSLSVLAGEIHAVLGENGAGKEHADERSSTAYVKARRRRDARGRASRSSSTTRRMRAISASAWCSSTFRCSTTLTVVENVALALPGQAALAPLGRRITEVSERCRLPVDPRRLAVFTDRSARRQRYEIIRLLVSRSS